MNFKSIATGLFTDYYELTMAQGYFLQGRKEEYASFDYFFRSAPFGGEFTIFAGLEDLSELLQKFRFNDEDIDYLNEQGFERKFLDYLKNFTLNVEIHSAREGEIVFPEEPVLRVEGKLIEAQLIETIVLNVINFESLIATKARRIKMQAGNRPVIDFGLRRAQGMGGLQASRAAYIGGVEKTSNVISAKEYGIPATGTMAHSWIQSYDDELKAFRHYAEIFPDQCILLIDTYDTLKSGLPNAIKVGKELQQKGHELFGVRLDSGDPAELSKRVRAELDKNGLESVKIVASNSLNEYAIKELNKKNAPIDSFGVGTSLVTGHDDPALDGVYKLAYAGNKPRMKFSENPAKTSLPGKKTIYRFLTDSGHFAGDAICPEDKALELESDYFKAPLGKEKIKFESGNSEKIIYPFWRKGKPVNEKKAVKSIFEFSEKRFMQLPDEYKLLKTRYDYPVGIHTDIVKNQNEFIEKIKSKY